MLIYWRSIVFSIISPTPTRTNNNKTLFNVYIFRPQGGKTQQQQIPVLCVPFPSPRRISGAAHVAVKRDTGDTRCGSTEPKTEIQHNTTQQQQQQQQINTKTKAIGTKTTTNSKTSWDKGYDWVKWRNNMQEQWEILIILVIVFFIWIILMIIMMQRSTRGRRRSLCKCIGATQSSDLGNIQSIQAVAI